MQPMKHVFVSGGATGIGLATLEMLLAQGDKVSLFDLSSVLPVNLQDAINQGQLIFSQGDVGQRADADKAVQVAVGKFGVIDGAFLNAGIHRSGSIMELTNDDLERVVAVNMKGMVNCLQACLPHMQTRGGSIVLMGSDQSFIGKPRSFVYGMTKGAVGQITKSLALDLAQFNIRVNAVCPGTIRTPLAETAICDWAKKDLGGDIEKAWAMEAEAYPMKRVGQPAEVASVAVFLLGDGSSFMTGAKIPVDGGYTAQ